MQAKSDGEEIGDPLDFTLEVSPDCRIDTLTIINPELTGETPIVAQTIPTTGPVYSWTDTTALASPLGWPNDCGDVTWTLILDECTADGLACTDQAIEIFTPASTTPGTDNTLAIPTTTGN